MKYKQINKLTHAVETTKFKTNMITIRFFEPLDKTNATVRSMIPGLLESGTKSHPSKRKILQYLETLYDATLSSSVTKLGTVSIVSFTVVFVHKKYIEYSLVEEITNFLNELLFHPHFENGLFTVDALKEEKRLAKEYHLSKTNNKVTHSLNRLKHYMFEGEEYQTDVDGYLEEIDQITLEDVHLAYKRMLKENWVSVVYSGPKDDFSLLETLPFVSNKRMDAIDFTSTKRNKPQTISEVMNTSQAIYNIGLRTSIRQKSTLYPAMVLMNSIFGSAPNNMLFDTVREQHSLCYYIRSMYVGFKGVLYINTGIDMDNIQKAKALIFEQIDNLQKGKFDEELLKRSKTVLLSQLDQMLDYQGQIHSKVFVDVLLTRPFSLEGLKSEIQNVTKEQVIACANTITLDTEYVLGKEKYVWK